MRIRYIFLSIFVLFLFFVFLFPLFGEDAGNAKNKDEERLPVIIEEVEVTAQTPSQQPISSVSMIPLPVIEKVAPKNLGEIMNYTAGTYVTDGGKGESSLMIRGISKDRITLMYDGIPIAEPYFNTFDLKTFSASGLESIKVIKGAGSVLYGPNTLGGVVNLVSLRPTKPFLALSGDSSANGTFSLDGSAGYAADRFSALVNASWDKSDGFKWNNDGEREVRFGSDYDRKNVTGKLYFYPARESEIMAEVIYYTAEYGIPPALEYYRARYWRFKDWDRLQLNLGGVFPLFKEGSLKTRLYYINHFNVLDAYRTAALDQRQWESTYKNRTYGASVIGQLPFLKNNELKFSLNAGWLRVRQQGDVGAEWEKYNRNVYSLGIEDHLSFSPQWKLIAGVSIDYLEKHTGETKTMLNPILGVRYTPREWLSFHLSTAQKSRYPSMRALYSTSSGNPDLKDEFGRFVELGFTYQKSFTLEGAVFYNYFEDMIQSYRGLEGFHTYQNIGRARIFGFELEARKKVGVFDLNLNYTYLDAKDKDLDAPLDYTPKSQLNMFLTIGEIKGFSFSWWGVAVSGSQVKLESNPPFTFLPIPGYVTFHARIDKRIGGLTLFVKAENILDKKYYTEPGYPMKARTVSVGFDFRLD